MAIGEYPAPTPPSSLSVAPVPPVMTVNETLKLARISRAKLYEEINEGHLKTIMQGRRRYVLGPDCLAWLESKRRTGGC